MGELGFADWLRLRRRAAGMTQRDLAEASGVKQPLISALESGGRQPTEGVRRSLTEALPVLPSQLLRASRQEVLAEVSGMGGSDVRVFGSVAAGQDRPDSDLDLIVDFPPDADIVTLLTLEERLSEILTVPVDIISAHSSSPTLAAAIAEAVPL